jgi:hypothetical protein
MSMRELNARARKAVRLGLLSEAQAREMLRNFRWLLRTIRQDNRSSGKL